MSKHRISQSTQIYSGDWTLVFPKHKREAQHNAFDIEDLGLLHFFLGLEDHPLSKKNFLTMGEMYHPLRETELLVH